MTAQIVKHMPDDPGERVGSDPTLENFPLEPSLLPSSRRLAPRFGRTEWQSAYQRHVEMRIQRNPRDLHSHVRRVLMYHALDDKARSFGALVDLFLILGPRGRQLRGRMLSKCRKQLSPQEYNFLMSHFVSGLHTSQPLPAVPHSLLAQGISGTTQIVVRRDAEDRESQTPLARARRCLAEADLTGAQAILEAAVMEDPGSADVCRELLDLYRGQDLSHDFFATYAQCLSRNLAVPALWEEMDQHFRQRKNSPEPDAF
jgi:hypothetical protein